MNKLPFIYCITSLLLICFAIMPFKGVIATELILDDDKLVKYADSLYKEGEYYRAITEYQRLRYFFPDSSHGDKALLQIGRSYMAGESYQEAIGYWQRIIDDDSLDRVIQSQVYILTGLSLLELDKEKPFQLRSQHIESALGYFRRINENGSNANLIKGFVNDWESRKQASEKSPWLAGTLSALVPGAGSFYNGRYMEGTYAFFLTGLFALAAMEAQSKNQQGLSLVLGCVGIGFYGGSIYAAVNGVHKTNDKRKKDQLEKIRQRYGIWFIPENQKLKGRF